MCCGGLLVRYGSREARWCRGGGRGLATWPPASIASYPGSLGEKLPPKEPEYEATTYIAM